MAIKRRKDARHQLVSKVNVEIIIIILYSIHSGDVDTRPTPFKSPAIEVYGD